MAESRFREADLLRGLAILMVMLYHSIIVYPVNLHEIPWCAGLHSFLWTLQMPLFFLVSGFCYSRRRGLAAYYEGRVKRILIPHIFFSALDILPRVLENPLVNGKAESPAKALEDFFLYGGSDWFLLTLFIIACVFPLVEALIKKDRIRLAAALILSLPLYIFHDRVTDLFCLNMVCGFFVWYLAGYGIRLIADGERPGTFWERPASVPGALLMAALLYIAYINTGKRAAELMFVAAGAGLCLLVVRKAAGRVERLLDLSGRWSLQLYLLNPYALVFTRTLLCAGLGVTNAAVIITANFVFDVLLCIAGTLLVLDKIPPLRFLSGIK